MKYLIEKMRAVSSGDPYTHVFIISLVDITAPLPFEVIPEHFLDRAKPDEIEVFKGLLNTLRPIPMDFFLYERSQVQHVPGEQEGHITYQSDELPPDKWKYWSVSHKGYNHEIRYLQQASLLLKNEIEYELEFVSHAGSVAFITGSPAMASYLSEDEEFSQSRPTVQITIDDLKSIQTYYSLMKELKPEYNHIKKAVKLFDDLRSLPRTSDFILIGLFSIIESLISHSPELDFYHDSIKHQIKTKIPLLKKRFVRNFNYREYFGDGVKEEKILSRLYDYRSNIVHSGNSEMSADIARILKGKKEVKEFLKELTKQLLMISLREPELITDLKLC